MEIWSKCDICGRDIPVGELCYGLKKGNCICKNCCTGFENCTFTLAPMPTLTPPNEPLTSKGIDGNKHNNAAENLEWVTPQRNKLHAVYTGIDVPNYGIKRVYCVTNGEVYPSASFAARKLGLIDSSVAKVCRGRYKHTGGMVFRYV